MERTKQDDGKTHGEDDGSSVESEGFSVLPEVIDLTNDGDEDGDMGGETAEVPATKRRKLTDVDEACRRSLWTYWAVHGDVAVKMELCDDDEAEDETKANMKVNEEEGNAEQVDDRCNPAKPEREASEEQQRETNEGGERQGREDTEDEQGDQNGQEDEHEQDVIESPPALSPRCSCCLTALQGETKCRVAPCGHPHCLSCVAARAIVGAARCCLQEFPLELVCEALRSVEQALPSDESPSATRA